MPARFAPPTVDSSLTVPCLVCVVCGGPAARPALTAVQLAPTKLAITIRSAPSGVVDQRATYCIYRINLWLILSR